MKPNIVHLLVIVLLTAMGCKEESLLYSGENSKESGVYFFSVASTDINGNPLSYRDSLLTQFENDPIIYTERIVNVPVKVLGSIVDYDRTFKVKINGGTAVEGKDYEKLKSEYTIPAGKALTTIPVKLFRTARLLNESIYFDIQLEESKDFKLLLPIVVNKSNSTNMDATKFRLRFSEIIIESSYWKSYSPQFWGDWSVKKFKLLNSLMEWTNRDWSNGGLPGSNVAFGKFSYATTLFRMYLQERADKKEPIYEDDGVTLMQLAPNYAIDYSKL